MSANSNFGKTLVSLTEEPEKVDAFPVKSQQPSRIGSKNSKRSVRFEPEAKRRSSIMMGESVRVLQKSARTGLFASFVFGNHGL